MGMGVCKSRWPRTPTLDWKERKHAGLVKDLEALERAEVARLTKRSGGDPAEAAADRQRLDLHARVADLLEQLAVAGVEASRQRKLNAALSEKCEAMESAASRDAISRSTADRAMQALHKEFEDLRVEMVIYFVIIVNIVIVL